MPSKHTQVASGNCQGRLDFKSNKKWPRSKVCSRKKSPRWSKRWSFRWFQSKQLRLWLPDMSSPCRGNRIVLADPHAAAESITHPRGAMNTEYNLDAICFYFFNAFSIILFPISIRWKSLKNHNPEFQPVLDCHQVTVSEVSFPIRTSLFCLVHVV